MSSSSKKAASQRRNAAAKDILRVTRTIRQPWSTTGYDTIVRSVLGASYTLSLVLIGDARARVLSTTYRDKDTKSNVLTFPLDSRSGEVFLNIAKIRREAHVFGLSPEGHAKFLLIHACLHLKGYAHGSTMERAEDRLVRKFKIR
jgi:probable rRNA maturation factor